MSTYNPQELQSYLDNRDWTGAADYLSSFPAKNARLQNELDNKIAELREQGERQKSLLQPLTTDEQYAYHFINGIDGTGTVPYENGNIYGIKYNNLINNLKDVKGNKISAIQLDFHNNEGLSEYYDILGITPDKVYELGIKVKTNSENGHTLIDIPITNTRMIGLLNELDKTNKQRSMHIDPITGLRGLYRPYTINAINENQQTVPNKAFNYDNIVQAKNLVNEARRIQDRALFNQETIMLDEELYITPFLGQGQANAYKAMQRDLIDQQEYKRIVDERTDVYNRLLTIDPIVDKDIYFTELGNRQLQPVNTKDKKAIKLYIDAAIQDKRITYSSGILNGEVGTFIQISQKYDKNNNPVKGDINKGGAIFIPGLFKSSADEAFAQDTRTQATRKRADMKRWNYGTFLRNGDYVGYDKNIGAYILDKNEYGEQDKIPISEEDLLRKLNRNYIINNTINNLSRYLDDEGNPLSYHYKGEEIFYDIDERANLAANAGINELYPKGAYTEYEREIEQVGLYSAIIQGLYDTIRRSKAKSKSKFLNQ